MQWLRNLPVARKFVFAFGIVCCLCVLLGTYTCVTFRGIARTSLDVSSNSMPSIIAMSDLRGAANTVRRQDLDLLLCASPDLPRQPQGRTAKVDRSLSGGAESLRADDQLPRERQLYQKFSSGFAQYLESSNQAVAKIEAGKVGDALDMQMSEATVAGFSAIAATMTEDLNLNAKYGTDESTPSRFPPAVPFGSTWA